MQFLMFFYAIVISFSSALAATDSGDLTGHYNLHGSMEMASELMLRKDGTFTAEIVYGSAEGVASGTWHVDGDVLSLKNQEAPFQKTALDVNFNLYSERNLAEADFSRKSDSDRVVELAQNNYVLEMQYSSFSLPPPIQPVDVFLDFSQGPPSQLLWRSSEEWRFSLPYVDKRVLKRIGFRIGAASSPAKWFAVSDTARWLSVEWKKKPGQTISFNQPYELDLAETKKYYEGNPDALAHVAGNYLITLHYKEEVITPAIKPTSVFWYFEDGVEQQQIWSDSKQGLMFVPFKPGRILKKIGFQEQGSEQPIQWLDVSPSGRWFSVHWKEQHFDKEDDLSAIFNGMTLEIRKDCLIVDFGNGGACFRK